MNLYVLTPAVPRHDCHNQSIIPSVNFLAKSRLFENIIWFVNIDNPKSKMFQFEDRQKTVDNFRNYVTHKNIQLEINLPEHPCFYNAFSYLIKSTNHHIDSRNISSNEFCILWLEDDWCITNFNQIIIDLKYFIKNNINYYTLYKHKVNIGGNPQFINGYTYNSNFKNIDTDPTNKRDPEIIMRNEIFRDHIFEYEMFYKLGVPQDVIHNNRLTFKDKLIIANKIAESKSDTYELKQSLHGHVVNDIGDYWRDLRGFEKWDMIEKEHGIKSNQNYTYK